MEYTPDKWCLVEINHNDTTLYKVFGSWYGGYTTGDSWRLNSGILDIESDQDYYIFKGYSSSEYICHKNGYGSNLYGSGVLSSLVEKYGDKLRVMEEAELPNVLNQFINKDK